MASLGKKEFAKRDMNFFSEFAASSQAYAKAAGIAVIAGIAVVAITVLVCIMKFINFAVVDKQVKYYDELFKSDEYVRLAIDAQDLAEESTNMHKYSYVLKSIETNVAKDSGASFDIINSINESIPSNVILTSYQVNKGNVIITGESITKSAPSEMVNMLKGRGLLVTRENLSTERVNPSDLASSEKMSKTYIQAKYKFVYEGSIDVNCAVKISYIGPNNAILSKLDTKWAKSGEVLPIKDIATITANGQDYTLDSILINGKSVSKEELLKAQTATEDNPGGILEYIVNDDARIDLYYVVATINTSTKGA